MLISNCCSQEYDPTKRDAFPTSPKISQKVGLKKRSLEKLPSLLGISSLSCVLGGDGTWNKEGDNPDHSSGGFTKGVRGGWDSSGRSL